MLDDEATKRTQQIQLLLSWCLTKCDATLRRNHFYRFLQVWQWKRQPTRFRHSTYQGMYHMEPIWIYMPLVTALSGVLYQGHVTAALIITAFTSTSGRPSAMESLQRTAGQSCPPNCPHINIKATPITSTFKFRHSNFWDAFWDLEVPKLNCYYFFWIYFGITKGHQKDSCPRNKAKASSHWLELAHAFVTWSGRISQDLIGIRCMWLRYPIGTYTRVI